MSRVRLLIVDAHPIIEEGLEFLFEEFPDFEIVATANDGLEGLTKLQQHSVDVVLLEMNLPKVGGIEAIRLYLEEKPDIPILVYSGHNDEPTVFGALKAGARGYILKTAPLSELIEGIRKVHHGDYALSPSLNPAIIEFYVENRERGFDLLADYETLTEREKQVFRLLANGVQTQEIANALCISPKTVGKHRVAIKDKLSLNNPAEMAKYAIRIGLISVDTPSNGLADKEKVCS